MQLTRFIIKEADSLLFKQDSNWSRHIFSSSVFSLSKKLVFIILDYHREIYFFQINFLLQFLKPTYVESISIDDTESHEKGTIISRFSFKQLFDFISPAIEIPSQILWVFAAYCFAVLDSSWPTGPVHYPLSH